MFSGSYDKTVSLSKVQSPPSLCFYFIFIFVLHCLDFPPLMKSAHVTGGLMFHKLAINAGASLGH